MSEQVPSAFDDLAFRESAFAWLRAGMLTTDSFTRDELSRFSFEGATH